MEYQKTIILLGNKSNQPSNFRTKNWAELNDESRGTTMLIAKLNLKLKCWSLFYVITMMHIYLLKGNTTVNNTAAAGAAANNTNKKVIFKSCALSTNISEINNTQVENANNFDMVMSMYNWIEYSDNYLKISASLWQYCKDIPTVNDNGNIVEWNSANATDSFNFKAKITGQNDNNRRIDNVEIMVPLKYLSTFWWTLEMWN